MNLTPYNSSFPVVFYRRYQSFLDFKGDILAVNHAEYEHFNIL
jgi:hypothetical protein